MRQRHPKKQLEPERAAELRLRKVQGRKVLG
jgi:hypothetical protein